MAEMSRRKVKCNGIEVEIAEQGVGPLVLLLHGFPETSYSWRYQLPALAAAGFHAVAPDMRGNGGSTGPDSVEEYTAFHFVGDLEGLLEALGEKETLLVAHDWGATHAWDFCLLRPHLVRAIVCLGVPFQPRLASGSYLSHYVQALGSNFYMARFQIPGLIEAEYERCGTANALRRIFSYGTSSSTTSFLTDEDIAYYARTFQSTGWTGALNAYRNIERSWQLKAAWTDCGVNTPALFLTGDRDPVYSFPGMREYIHDGSFQRYVPNLQAIIVLEDSHHFIHQERHQIVSTHIIDFFNSFLSSSPKST